MRAIKQLATRPLPFGHLFASTLLPLCRHSLSPPPLPQFPLPSSTAWRTFIRGFIIVVDGRSGGHGCRVSFPTRAAWATNIFFLSYWFFYVCLPRLLISFPTFLNSFALSNCNIYVNICANALQLEARVERKLRRTPRNSWTQSPFLPVSI